MKFMRLLFLFLAVSLIIQNTCPYGMAGKTGFVSKEMHQCPLKKLSHSEADTDDAAKKTVFQAGQAFVFIGNALNAIPVSVSEVSISFSAPDLYKNFIAEPPIKPPSV